MIKEHNINQWINELASKAPTPGGGGASALGGALGAALGQMVANLTVGKKRYAEFEQDIVRDLSVLGILQDELLTLADRDAEVFAPLARAYSLPEDTQEQKRQKEQIKESCLLEASLVPMEMLKKTLNVLEILEELEEKGSRMAVSDIGVAVQFARAALNGAVMNIYINTHSMKNREKAEELNKQAKAYIDKGVCQADMIYRKVLERLGG